MNPITVRDDSSIFRLAMYGYRHHPKGGFPKDTCSLRAKALWGIWEGFLRFKPFNLFFLNPFSLILSVIFGIAGIGITNFTGSVYLGFFASAYWIYGTMAYAYMVDDDEKDLFKGLALLLTFGPIILTLMAVLKLVDYLKNFAIFKKFPKWSLSYATKKKIKRFLGFIALSILFLLVVLLLILFVSDPTLLLKLLIAIALAIVFVIVLAVFSFALEYTVKTGAKVVGGASQFVKVHTRQGVREVKTTTSVGMIHVWWKTLKEKVCKPIQVVNEQGRIISS